jgi:hypothetical protein
VVAALALAASGAAQASIFTPEGEGCQESSVALQLSKVEFTDGKVRALGHFKVAGPASAVLLEYIADSDRYAAQIRQVKEADLQNAIPYLLCGKHALRVTAYPLVTIGDRQLVCLRRAGTAKLDFSAPCGAEVRVSAAHWSCEAGSCAGNLTVIIGDGKGTYDLMMSIGRGQFRKAPSGTGPFQLAVACEAGEKVRLRARGTGSGGYTGTAELLCGQP